MTNNAVFYNTETACKNPHRHSAAGKESHDFSFQDKKNQKRNPSALG
jgi:hypothetical protein